MSLSSDSVLNRDNLNRAYVSKSATGTQIMAGSLRLLGGITIDGVTTLGTLTVGAINAGASAITTTGTITAGTFSGAHSGSGASLTALNGTNITTGTVADARLSTNVMVLGTAQTITTNKTFSAAANLYFAGGTTYKIDTAGSASFNALNVAGSVTLDGNDYITFGSVGVAAPSDTSVGTKIKLFGNSYQLGIEGSSIWYDSANNHKFYTNNGTATRTLRAEITETDTHIFTDLNVDKNLEVVGEFKAGVSNEFPDPLLASQSVGGWAATGATATFDAVQAPKGTGAKGSLVLTATAAVDANVYSSDIGDVLPGEWVTFSAYVFSTTASKSAQLMINWRKADGGSSAVTAHSANGFTAPTGWARYSVTGQAPSDATTFRVRLDNDGGVGAIIYYSAFQVERGRTLTGFKPYAGGTAASFFDKGIVIGSGGEIHSGYNNAYILKDFGNSNVTLSAAGGTLHLGYNNTSKVILSTALYGVNATTQIAGTDGTLYYQGVDTDTRYVNVAGDTMTGALTMGANSIIGSSAGSWINLGTTPTFSTVSSLIIHADSDNSSTTEYVSIKAGVDELKIVSDGAITFNTNKVWHAGNDGSGSGLDADLLDGLNNTSFMRTDANTSTTGTITIGTGTTSTLANQANGALRHSNSFGYIELGPQNSTWAHIYTDRPSFYFNKELHVLGNKVWNAGNDGAGSGLDADLLDGRDSSGYLQLQARTTEDFNTLRTAGVYGTGPGNLNLPDAPYGSLIVAPNSDTGLQLYGGYNTGDLWFRGWGSTGTTFYAWNKVWHDNNDGAGSGLDADLLDGLQGASYLRSDASDTFTGTLTLVGSQTISGALDVAGNLDTDGDLSFSKLPYLKGVIGSYREDGKMNLLGRLSGRLLNRNPDFINNTMTGYSTYDLNTSGRLIRSIIADDVIPNSTGKLMRLDYDPARNAGVTTTPGFGGFTISVTRSISNPTGWGYKAGNRYVFRTIAKIPIGRSINFASNATGTGGGGTWLTPTTGTADWTEYIYLFTIGNTGTFDDTGFFSITGGADVAFTWDVASCQVIGIDEMPDVDRAPTLNVGYKSGVDIGWGEIYSTGKIITDSNVEAKGDYVLATNKYLKTASGNSSLVLLNSSNNMHLIANEGNKAFYIDSDNLYIRSSAGVQRMTVAPNGDTTILNNLTVAKAITVTGLTVAKTANVSTVAFPAGTGGNDAGYIKHIETTVNSGIMQFSASDDAADNDYFSFGATPSSVYTEGARITTLGNATFKTTTVTSLASSGNVVVSGDLSIPTSASDKAALSIGAVTIGQAVANSSELIITNLSELRFGSASNATWDYNKWGGIKYITGSNTMVIGGPASANFTGLATPPRINLNFEGVAQANLDGKMVISPTVTSTIGGATMANGYLLIGSIADGIAFDPNEMYFSGGTGIIGTIGAYDLSFQPAGAVRMTLNSVGASVVGTVTATGDISGAKVTASGGVSVPSGGNIHIGTFGDSAASLRLHYSGTSGYVDFGGDLYFRSGTTERMRLSAAGNLGVKTTPSSSYGISTDSIIVSNWIRTTGATGWYSETYGGGWNMSDATWIRSYGSKSLFIGAATSTIRTEGKLEVGAGTAYTAAADFQVVAGVSGTFNYRNVLYSDGAKVGIGAASATHPLDVHTSFGAQGINLQTTDDALTNGFSLQNSAGTYSWHLARNGTGVSPDLVLYGGSNATLSSLTEKVRYYNNGDTNFTSRMLVRGNSGAVGGPTITLAIGDTDTGLNWVSDGNFNVMANNVAAMNVTSTVATFNAQPLINNNLGFSAVNGRGVRFWDSDSYKIWMSATSDATWGGGGMPGAAASDYNFYYRIAGVTRGHIFQQGTTTLAQIDGDGKVHSKAGFKTGKFEVVHNATEDSLDFVYTG